MSKSDKKIKGKICALVVLGMFAVLMLAQPVAAANIPMGDDEWIGLAMGTGGHITFDSTPAPDQIEIMEADVGIYDEDPDFRLEVAATSGDGYFGVSSAADNDGDVFIIDSSGNVGIWTASPSTTLHVNGDVAFGAGLELTISGGVVTATHSYHTIDTQSDAGSDDLDTINAGSVAGEILIIRAEHTDRTVVAKDGANLKLSGGDFNMDNTEDTLTLIFDGSNWLEISRSDNGPA